ncbi:MAG: GrpB family protein [Candidatus Limnocylindria bacterium]
MEIPPEHVVRANVERWERMVASGEVVMFGTPSGQAVTLSDPDRSWATHFEEVRDKLVGALGDVAVRIDHVGSTSIPGIVAKPIIDVQVSVPDIEDEDAYRPAIESLGWPMRSREPGHRYFRDPSDQPRRVQIHVCEAGGEWERDHLLFRDYLCAHPSRAAEYGELKRALAALYGTSDRVAYTEAKTPFIRETVRFAEEWAARINWQTAGR